MRIDRAWAELDKKRCLHMTVSASILGPWFAWWFPYLNKFYSSYITRTLLELLTVPFLHTVFLSIYSHMHYDKMPSIPELINLIYQLVAIDFILYFPVALFNFRFIPPGIYQTIFVNAAYVFMVEPLGSLIINDGLRIQDILSLLVRLITSG